MDVGIDPCSDLRRRELDWAEVSVSVPSVANEPVVRRVHAGLSVPAVVDGPVEGRAPILARTCCTRW